MPRTSLVDDEGDRNRIAVKDDKFIFPGGGSQVIHGADQYLNQILQVGLFLNFSKRFLFLSALD